MAAYKCHPFIVPQSHKHNTYLRMQLSDQIKWPCRQCTRSRRVWAGLTRSMQAHGWSPVEYPSTSFVDRQLHWLAALTLMALPHIAIAQADVSGADTGSATIVLSNLTGPAVLQTSPDLVAAPGTDNGQVGTDVSPESNERRSRNASQGTDLRRLIAQVARESGVGADLIAAVAAAESGFDPMARSPKGALGLMQLMPATARRFGVQDIWKVEDNLRGGAAYLRWLLDHFGGDISLAVAAYNAGEHAVIKAGRRIPAYAETLRYVPRVLAWREQYAAEFGQQPGLSGSATHAPTAPTGVVASRRRAGASASTSAGLDLASR